MATLYVSEFGGLAVERAQVMSHPPLASQTIAIAGASAQATNAFKPDTRLIRVHTDAICSVAIGPNPTAVTTAMRMVAGATEYFGVMPGDKIAVISNT